MSAKHNRTYRHLAYALIAVLTVILAGYFKILPVFRGHLTEYLNIGNDRFGLLLSVGPACGILGGLLGGIILDRWGPRRVIRLCVTGIGSAMLVLAAAGTNFLLFTIALGTVGFFMRPLTVAVNAYLGKLFPRHQRRVVSLNLASSSVGGIMFPIIAEGLLFIAQRSPSLSFAQVLHLPFLASGLSVILTGFIFRPRKKTAGFKTPKTNPANTLLPSWQDFKLPPRLLFLALLIAMHGSCDSVLHMWMAHFLESDSFPVTVIAPGLILSGFAGAYITSRLILGLLPDHFGPRLLMTLPGLVGGSLMFVSILSRNYLFTGFGYILSAFIWSTEFPNFLSTVLRSDKRKFGTVMAVAGICSGLGIFLGMNLTGILIDRVGEENMWLVMLAPAAGFALIGIGGGYWNVKYSRIERPISPRRSRRKTKDGI